MKLTLDHGIDYAVAAKRGDLPDLDAAYRFGMLVYMLVLMAISSPSATFLIFLRCSSGATIESR